jgi:hypothetical protein
MAKIALDCDGVLANFISAFADEANRMWPGTFPKNYWKLHTQWNIPSNLLSTKQVDQVWEKIKATENWWMRLDPHHDSVGALAIFFYTQRCHEVHIVTSRVPTIGQTISFQTDVWLRACGVNPCLNYLGVLPVANSDHKVEIYDFAGFDFSIDDKLETVQQCDALPKHKAFLLDRPWNQSGSVKNRVKSVQEFLDAVVKVG